jgi:hypothetical protein
MIQKYHPLRSGALAAAALLCSLTLAPGPARAATPVSTLVYRDNVHVPGEPATVVFTNFSIPAINDAGDIAFQTDFVDLTNRNVLHHGIYDGQKIVVDELDVAVNFAGDPLMGGGVHYYSFMAPALNHGGYVAFNARLKLATNAITLPALYTNLDGGLMRLMARPTGAAPGIPNATIMALVQFALTDQAIFFTGKLYPNGTTITSTNDEVLWMWKPGLTTPVVVMREGTPLADYQNYPLVKFRALTYAASSPGHGRSTSGAFVAAEWQPFGATYHAALVCDTTTAAGSAPGTFRSLVPGSVPPVGVVSGAMPGLPATNPTGDVAVLSPVWSFLVPPPLVTSGIATGTPAQVPADYAAIPIRVKSVTVPGGSLPFVSGSFFTAIKEPALNASGDLATLATAWGTGVSSITDTCVLRRAANATTVVVREGENAVDLPGNVPVPAVGKYKQFTEFALPDGTGPLFKALTTGLANTAGLWAQDDQDAVQLIVRKGTVLPAGQTISSFTVLGIVAGSSDQRRSFNANAQVAYSAYFTGGRGIVRVKY